jgi:CxxC-x17-CxxC domain-containing protein
MQTVAGEKIDKEKILDKESAPIHFGTCQKCGRGVQVPFEPDPSKPLYCKQCLKDVRRVSPKRPAKPLSRKPTKPVSPTAVSPEKQAVRQTAQENQKKFKQDLADLLHQVSPLDNQPPHISSAESEDESAVDSSNKS